MPQQLTLAYLNEKLEKLETKCQRLELQQEWMGRIFQSYGIGGMWVSPQQAADLFCISREGVMWHVRRAECFRELKRDCECKYGVHYRAVPQTRNNQPRKRPNWQIHIGEFEKLLAIPQDGLRPG
jgi:hypothetical protein